MVAGDIRVKVIPDTAELDKELKKPRMFAGLLGLDGGKEDKKDKATEKGFDKLTGGVMKMIGSIVGIGVIFSGLFKLLRPFVELFTALSFLVFFPLWKALKPALEGLSKFVSNVAKEGGGVTGLIRGGEKTLEEGMEGKSIWKRIGTALLAGLLGVVGIIVVGILGGLTLIPILIIAGIAAIITLLILAWDPLVKFFNIIVDAWKAFFKDVGKAWDITVEFFKKLGKRIGEFGADLWQFFVDGLKLVLEFGLKIWDFFLDGLSFISNLGERIWNFIKDALGSLGGFIGGGLKNVGSFLNPFNDFIQRPGQSPTSFSPNDTIIGVKDPSQLFGGGSNITQHISIQATINNDMDIRNLAERLAELSKSELAMSTGSQRF